MKKIYEAVKNIPLFTGIAFSAFERMLNCLSAKTICYKKGDVVLLSGDTVSHVGLVLSENIQIIREDVDGNITILAEFATSELFGEVFACAGIDHSPVTVQSAGNSEVLFVNYRKIITSCSSACPFHHKLIENMLSLIAKKNLMLNQKIEILSKRTTREKLLCFFDTQRGTAKKFTLPFNREEMAQYLCVDRSAMSNELAKMKKDGLIDYEKNSFTII